MRLGGGRLDHRAVGRKIAAQHRQAVARGEGFLARQNHLTVENFGISDILAQ